MLLFSGADKAAALAYAKLFALAQFTLVVREPRRPAAAAAVSCFGPVTLNSRLWCFSPVTRFSPEHFQLTRG